MSERPEPVTFRIDCPECTSFAMAVTMPGEIINVELRHDDDCPILAAANEMKARAKRTWN